jgi:hypothetical protein
MKRYSVIILLAILGLVGCAGPKPYTLGKVVHEVPPPQADRAQVVFYYAPIEGTDTVARDGGILEISEDDEVVSDLRPQTHTLHEAMPGDR